MQTNRKLHITPSTKICDKVKHTALEHLAGRMTSCRNNKNKSAVYNG